MKWKRDTMITLERRQFNINTSTNPTNIAEGYEDGTLIARRAGTVTTVSGWSCSHFQK